MIIKYEQLSKRAPETIKSGEESMVMLDKLPPQRKFLSDQVSTLHHRSSRNTQCCYRCAKFKNQGVTHAQYKKSGGGSNNCDCYVNTASRIRTRRSNNYDALECAQAPQLSRRKKRESRLMWTVREHPTHSQHGNFIEEKEETIDISEEQNNVIKLENSKSHLNVGNHRTSNKSTGNATVETNDRHKIISRRKRQTNQWVFIKVDKYFNLNQSSG